LSDDWVDPRVEARRRKRAAVALIGIGVLAGLVVLLGVGVFKAQTASKTTASGPRPLDSLLNSATPSAARHASSSSAPGSRASSASAGSASPTPTPTKTRHPVASCPTSTPCMLSQDGGDLIGAINRYRAAHGVAQVPGKVSVPAERCAIGNGDSANCPPSYYWEPVTRWKGKDVVEKIVNNGGGAEYLLDPSVKSIAVGWAYDPVSKTYYGTVVTHY